MLMAGDGDDDGDASSWQPSLAADDGARACVEFCVVVVMADASSSSSFALFNCEFGILSMCLSNSRLSSCLPVVHVAHEITTIE